MEYTPNILEQYVKAAWQRFRLENELPDDDINEILVALMEETPRRQRLMDEVQVFYDAFTTIENFRQLSTKFQCNVDMGVEEK
jgi:hypothetical protein